MNLQEILQPIGDLLVMSFGILEAGENYVNWLLIIIITLALVYWTVKLARFQDEVPNR